MDLVVKLHRVKVIIDNGHRGRARNNIEIETNRKRLSIHSESASGKIFQVQLGILINLLSLEDLFSFGVGGGG